MQREMPEEVRRAFEHVRQHHSHVIQVFFDYTGRWLYMDEDMEAPTFCDAVDVGILEDASDAVDRTGGFPAAFFYKE